jgi:2-oxoacid:acceptor oxidoreductase gamma subunit (pyruvate/2-ketoisovalerate family)
MIEVRFHGRGGQGAVVASEILAKAAVKEGMFASAFPFFGVERRGAPVMAFCLPQYPLEMVSTGSWHIAAAAMTPLATAC